MAKYLENLNFDKFSKKKNRNFDQKLLKIIEIYTFNNLKFYIDNLQLNFNLLQKLYHKNKNFGIVKFFQLKTHFK